ncbi:MAG: CaiB/BaiF CoA transferase family protein [Ilumatobacteraceae bacterium]
MTDTAEPKPTIPLGREVLSGVKVVEFAHVIAGPLAGTLMADLGAEVVHVEEPTTGDPGRKQGPPKDDTYLWWKVSARNKRSVTLDLREPEGQQLAHKLAAWADVVIVNMRYDTLVKWQLDFESLHEVNPKLVMLQISGFGANTSMRNAPGFGKVGEARSGVVYLTGFEDGPPVHTGFSHADTVTALMGAFAIQCALYRREVDPEFAGEWIDLALFESLFRLVEWQVIVYDQLGRPPERAGNRLAVAPAAVINTYMTRDGHWLTVTSGTPRSVWNIAAAVGVPHADVATVELQATNADRLDQALREWIGQRDLDECTEKLAELEVTASPIYSMAEIMRDPIYAERKDIISIEDPDLGEVKMQGVVPRFDRHPGHVWRTGPALGEDDDVVYREYVGLDDGEFDRLKAGGIIGRRSS